MFQWFVKWMKDNKICLTYITEIRDTVKGGQNSYVHMSDEVIVERMNTIEEINTTEEKLVDKTVFEKIVCPCQNRWWHSKSHHQASSEPSNDEHLYDQA